MKTKKLSLFFILLTGLISAWLFYLKYNVMEIENKIRQTRRIIAEEEKNQHILKAEWKTLTSPERIQRLTKRYLSLEQIEPMQLREYDASIFHSEEKKYKETKKLSKIVREIIAQQDNE